MRHPSWTLLFTLCLSLCLPLSVAAQAEAGRAWAPTRAIVSGGLGTGSRDIAVHAGLSVGGPRRELILRWAMVSDFEIFSPSTVSQDVALLMAFRSAGARSWYRGALGIGHVRSGLDGCSPGCPTSSTAGLAFQAEAVFAPSRAFGLGAQLFGNLNTVDAFAGVTLSIHLGLMR